MVYPMHSSFTPNRTPLDISMRQFVAYVLSWPVFYEERHSMVQHRSLETNPWKNADLSNKAYVDYGKETFCSHTLGAVVLLVLGLAWGVQGVIGEEQPGFTQDCSGFAQDPMLGALWRGMPLPI
jgi:hypothetical protein